MKWERLILIAFFANYLINNVVAAIAALIPATQGSTSIFTPQYIFFMIAAMIVNGIFAWWYLKKLPGSMTLKWGIIYGVLGFVISILTTFVSGIAGVLAQTGSFSELWSVLPNFGPFLWSKLTIVLFVYWVLPAILVGWYLARNKRMVVVQTTTTSTTI